MKTLCNSFGKILKLKKDYYNDPNYAEQLIILKKSIEILSEKLLNERASHLIQIHKSKLKATEGKLLMERELLTFLFFCELHYTAAFSD